jgi:hypothetical protein
MSPPCRGRGRPRKRWQRADAGTGQSTKMTMMIKLHVHMFSKTVQYSQSNEHLGKAFVPYYGV